MDIQIEKYKLMEWLINLKDESMISMLKSIKNNHRTSSDEWETSISETEKGLITEGLKNIEEADTYTHEEVMKELKDTYDI